MAINDESLKEFRKSLRILEREIDIELKDETNCCGVTLSQCHILLELYNSSDVSVSSLSEAFGLDKSTLSRTVDGMVADGLIERRINSDDRRSFELILTAKGVEKINLINAGCNAYYAELLKQIPAGKHRIILESLKLLGVAMRRMRDGEKKSCCNIIK